MLMKMRPSSSMSTSTRSPGSYGGSPDMNSSIRSSRSSPRPTPNTRPASSRVVPGCCTRYGTITNSQPRRSEVRAAPLRVSPGTDRLESGEHLVAEFGGAHHRRVGTELQHPSGELGHVAERQGDLRPPV